MDAYGTARLAAKDAESAIVARICEDFNLTPVLARAHYEQMARYFADFGHMALQPGELVYLAVASDEPPGKPIIACRKVQVALELAGVEDREVLRDKGLAAMRQQSTRSAGPSGSGAGRAVDGGGSGLFDVFVDGDGETGPGRVPGRRRSRCRRGVRSATSARACRTRRRWCSCICGGCSSPRSSGAPAIPRTAIRRYLADFRQIAALYARGASIPEIRAATGRSAGVIGEYIGDL